MEHVAAAVGRVRHQGDVGWIARVERVEAVEAAQAGPGVAIDFILYAALGRQRQRGGFHGVDLAAQARYKLGGCGQGCAEQQRDGNKTHAGVLHLDGPGMICQSWRQARTVVLMLNLLQEVMEAGMLN
eukprot:gene31116-35118_t